MKIAFVGDVITQPFSGLSRYLGLGECAITHHGIDQNLQVLMSEMDSDVLISHARAEFFLESAPAEDPLDKMAAYCDAIGIVAASGKTIVVVNSLLPPRDRMVGVAHLGMLKLVGELNAKLIDLAMDCPFVTLADLAAVITSYGTERALNVQNDLVMRMPYTRAVLPLLIAEYGRVIRERFVPRKKALLLDADNTLWGGIVGEDGIDGIAIDTQFPGIVHRKFQQSLLALKDSGILLTLVTKNNEADVREVFDTINMPLKWDDFAAIRANWELKSDNIESIANELKIGTDAMVFIDDNPFEIEQVRCAHPMLDCHQFDARSPNKALQLIYNIRDLNTWSLTVEDGEKSAQYRQEAERRKLAGSTRSLADYIKSLDIKIEAGINRREHVKRIAQLTNKTNQFNLTTRRYSEADVIGAMERGFVFDFRVSDKFGDMGIVGVAVVLDSEIETFLMSCRALGRRLETQMLKYVCKKVEARPLRASFTRSAKNDMAAEFYESNGFLVASDAGGTKTYTFDSHDLAEIELAILEVS